MAHIFFPPTNIGFGCFSEVCSGTKVAITLLQNDIVLPLSNPL